MSALEQRYRRLLASYPRRHREEYAEEMLGVLLAGARPGQRFPDPRDAFDVLRAGFAARLRGGGPAGSWGSWPDAAAVLGLIGAIVLAVVPLRRVLSFLAADIPGGPTLGSVPDVLARGAAWLLVVAVSLAGLRRAAVGLAGLAAALDVAALAWSAAHAPDGEWVWLGLGWLLVLAPLTVALLALGLRGSSPVAVLGRRGAALVLAGPAVLLATTSTPMPATLQVFSPSMVVLAGVAVGGVLLVAGVLHARRSARLPLIVLFVPMMTVWHAQSAWQEVMGVQFRVDVTVGLVISEAAFLLGIPLLLGAVNAVLLAAVTRLRWVSRPGRADM